MEKRAWTTVFEVAGSGTGILYALLIASNTGREVLGFILLFITAAAFATWAVMDRRWAFLALQGFYIATAVLGVFRWS